MNAQEKINGLTALIQQRVDGFNESIPEVEKRLYRRLLELLKELKVVNNRVVNGVENLNTINKILPELEKVLSDAGYNKKVGEFTKTFDEVRDIQNNYFAGLNVQFTPPKVLKELHKANVNWTKDKLIKNGISASFAPGMQKILTTAMTSGGEYADLTEQMRNFIMSGEGGDGALLRYSRQVTTDSLNFFSANYHETITQDLGLKWRVYTGSLLETSRDWCELMVAKRYVHEAELLDCLTKEIDGVEVGSEDLPINKKTGLPRGLMEGTDQNSVKVNRGGWQCGHQWISVTEDQVPLSIRLATYAKYGIGHNNGVANGKTVKPKAAPAAEEKPAPAPIPKKEAAPSGMKAKVAALKNDAMVSIVQDVNKPEGPHSPDTFYKFQIPIKEAAKQLAKDLDGDAAELELMLAPEKIQNLDKEVLDQMVEAGWVTKEKNLFYEKNLAKLNEDALLSINGDQVIVGERLSLPDPLIKDAYNEMEINVFDALTESKPQNYEAQIASMKNNSKMLEPKNLLRMAGVPADLSGTANIVHKTEPTGTMYTTVRVFGEGLKMERTIEWSKGVVTNDEFKIKDESRYKKTGGLIFESQVKMLRAAGFKRIDTYAARSDEYNGYYTWPRLGYDAPLNSYAQADILKDTGIKAETFLELFKTVEGREWWRQRGASVHLSYSLQDKEKNKHIKTMFNYLNQKYK